MRNNTRNAAITETAKRLKDAQGQIDNLKTKEYLTKGYSDTLYVALTGNQTIAGVKTFSSRLDAVAFRTSFLTIADDAVGTYAPTGGAGILILNINNEGTVNGTIAFRAASGPFCNSLGVGSDVNVTTGALTGTTGTDGKFTVSAHTDGNLYFENRRGASRTVVINILGG